jgi:hypothetical protein
MRVATTVQVLFKSSAVEDVLSNSLAVVFFKFHGN